MSIPLKLQGQFITFEQSDVMRGDAQLSLLADVDTVVTIEPRGHARIATPIAFIGDGKTLALIDMHAGRLDHALDQADEAIAVQGEYFLPSPGKEAIVTVDVINETGATLMIRPGTCLGVLTFINLAATTDDIEPMTEQDTLELSFHPLHLGDDAAPTYDECGHLPLRADLGYAVTIAPHCTAVVPTGLGVRLPARHEGQLNASPALPASLAVQNRPVHDTHDDVINIVLVNNSDRPVELRPGAEIAHLTITPLACPSLIFSTADTRAGENLSNGQ